MSIGNNIKKLRTENNLTQEQLADALGVARPLISQFERGSKTPTLALAAGIAKILNCTTDDLVAD
ncbi:MAG: helix-turn-helix domain-containing protein [Clostridiales bacterium]|nr:helix-turn-helix domain-containing protein [Clostridiales bacterium]